MKRTASAVWTGGLKDGSGTVSTERKAVSDVPVSFARRFEDTDKTGTNPEELVGAAHSSCFSMALAKQLEDREIQPERIETKATVTLGKTDAGFAVTTVHLDTTIGAPGADASKVQEAANAAKEGCPISKLLNAEITMDAKLA